MERVLTLHEQHARPPRRAGSRRQPRQVLLDSDTELMLGTDGPLCKRDRAAGPQCQQTALDGVAARDDARPCIGAPAA